MAAERLKSPRARLFVALDLPEDVREGLVAWQQELPRERALRILPPQNLHLTLVFLGYHPERQIERIAEVVGQVRADAPELRFSAEPVPVPRRQPRLFAIDAESPETEALQAQASRALEEAGFYKPEKRPFWPHLTVARVRAERGRRRPMRVTQPPERLPDALLEPFRAVRVTLYRSLLRSTGAEYVPVSKHELPRAAAER